MASGRASHDMERTYLYKKLASMLFVALTEIFDRVFQ